MKDEPFKDTAPTPENEAKPPALWGAHTFISLAATLAILVGLTFFVDLGRIWQELMGCRKGVVFLGALAHYATYPVRGARWRRCLRHLPVTCGNGRFGLLVFFYQAVDNVVPAKLGELYGAHLARINCGISRSTAIGSLVFARMLDAWVVLLAAVCASLAVFGQQLPRAVVWVLAGGGAIALAVTGILLAVFVLKGAAPGWVPEKMRRVIRDFQKGMWPRGAEIAPIVAQTVVIWSLELLWVCLLLVGFDVRLDVASLLFVTMVPLLASAVPLTPAGAGLVEITLFGCLRLVGMASSTAASITVLNRAMDYWLHIFLGLLVWAARRRIGFRTYREMKA
jgi:uncharacterized protein (TIRG00374 family)